MIRATSIRNFHMYLAGLLLGLWGWAAGAQTVQLVNVVPANRSSETRNDSEPNVTVNPANTNQIVVTAFTPCPPMISTVLAPIYFSIDGGTTWQLNCIVPGNSSATGTGDITPRFASAGGVLYAGILLGNSFLELNILRTADFTSPAAMTVLVDRTNEDQPYTQAISAGGDRVFIGNNNLVNSTFFGGVSGLTASVDLSANAATAPAPAGFGTNLLETRTTCGQDPPPIRPAIHPNGTVYAAYYRNQAASPCFSGTNTVDVVVARDDNWGAGGFTSLMDSDAKPGKRVVQGVSVVWAGALGNERLQGSQVSIAVDPNNSNNVYVAWADGPSATYALHVRRSTDGGASWGASDIKTVSPADNPALAVNKLGTVGFLYQKFVNPGTCHGGGAGVPCWETHFETYNGTTWTDLPQPLANVPDNAGTFPLGDYDHVLAIGQDFYGAFSANNYPDTGNFFPGVQYQRYADFSTHTLFADAAHTTTVAPSFDPFYFHVTNLARNSDFYVRDWTDTAASHDNGEEPSTGPVWWTTSDVWNRLTNINGGFNANDQPNHVVAQDAALGHNFAFVRVFRKAAPGAGATVPVTARFLYADYGLGVAYQDVSATPTATLNFAPADTVQVLADGLGVQWDVPATRSTHICMAVEISAGSDTYSPELAGRAPGWPTTDWTLPADNNKAQINMDLPPVATGAGTVSFHAIAHNAATFARDMVIRYHVDPEVFRKLEGAQLEVIGDKAHTLRESGTLTLANMQPGENRWLALSYSAPNAKAGESIPVFLEEMFGDAVVNGLTVSAQPLTLDQAIRAALKLHHAVFVRLDAAFRVKQAAEEAKAALALLQSPAITPQQYMGFLTANLGGIKGAIAELTASQKSADAFAAGRALAVLGDAIASNEPELTVNAHLSVLNKLDAFQTMLQKAQGDAGDILQMVQWQRNLYATDPRLIQFKQARKVVQESDEFLNAYGKPGARGDSYPQMIRELLHSFRDTAKFLRWEEKRLERAVDEMKRHLGSLDQLERAHREFLLLVSGTVYTNAKL